MERRDELADVDVGPAFSGRQISDVNCLLNVDMKAARLTAKAAIAACLLR